MVYNGGRRIFLRKEVCGMRNSVLRFTVFIAAFIAVIVMLSAVPEKAHAEEEDVFDNHWKVLTIIYTNVNNGKEKGSFSNAEVESIKEIAAGLPDNYKRLSGGRFLIDRIDFVTVSETVTSNTGYSGMLSYGPGEDIDFDCYLEGKDYDFVYVFAPLHDFEGVFWYGLGGMTYEYNGRLMYYATASNVPGLVGKKDCEIYGDKYDTRLGVMVHEMLHCIEVNSRSNGISFDAYVDGAEASGYVASEYGEWFDFYHDFTQDTLKQGNKGFSEESFYIHHPARVYVDSVSMEQETMDIKTGQTVALNAEVLPENADYQNLVWKSSDPNVAIVSQKGEVRGVTSGTAVISAVPNNSMLKAECVVTVTGEPNYPECLEDDGMYVVKRLKNGTVRIVSVNKVQDNYPYLDRVYIDGKAYKVSEIGPYAFKNCSGIRTIDLPKNVRSIGKGAFYGMKSLRSLWIGSGVNKIPAYMCKGCKKLKRAEMHAKLKSVGKDAFKSIAKKPKVYVKKKTPKKIQKKIKKMIRVKVRYC